MNANRVKQNIEANQVQFLGTMSNSVRTLISFFSGSKNMGSRTKIAVGQIFGRLTIIKELQQVGSRRYFACKCECGREKKKRIDMLNGKASCGCLGKEIRYKATAVHGEWDTRLHAIWSNMKQRCLNPKNTNYIHYGARGIEVCDEWMGYVAFMEWAKSNGYEINLTIERIDNNLGYSPCNCRWATRQEQANNTRRSLFITYNGQTKTLSQWSRKIGIDKGTLLYRIKHGWSVEAAFSSKPTHKFDAITFNGRTQSIWQWSKEMKIKHSTLFMRLDSYKWSVKRALTTPVGRG
jgi:hypothetical protein